MKKHTILLGVLAAALLVFIFSCSKRTNIHPLGPDDIFTATRTAVLSTATRTPTRTNTVIPSTATFTITMTNTQPTATDTPIYSPTISATITPTWTDSPAWTHTITPTITRTGTTTSTGTITPSGTGTGTPTVTETISVGGPPWPFDTSIMGFVNDSWSDMACTSVTWDGNAANAKTGPGSIYGTFDFTASATVQGYVLLDRTTSPINMTGKTLNVWVNIPAAIAGKGYGLQLVAKLSGVWNAQWFNLNVPGWQLFSFDVNKAGVTEVGVMICRNSSTTIYTGNIQIDEMYLSTMTPPGPPWTFDGNMEGFSRTGEPAITDIAWNGNPAGIENGTGSLAMTTDFTSSATAQGSIQKGISPSLNLTGKIFSVWLDVPASIAGTGYGIQVVAFNTASYTWNAQWFNLDNPGWQQFSWTVPAGLTDVRQIELQILRNNSPVAYTGIIYTDEWTITDAVASTATYTPTVTETLYFSPTDTPFGSPTDTDTPGATVTDTPYFSPTMTATPTVTETISIGGPPWPFDTSTMGFTNDIYTDLACTSVTWDGNPADAKTGPGSIYGTFDFSTGPTAQGYVLLDRSAAPMDFTNKTLNVWVNVPAAIAGQGYGLQLVAKNPTWNALWFNLDNPGWQLFSFNVNSAGVTEVGVMISRNNSTTIYTGNIQIDEMYLSTMTPPGPPWTFDGNIEGFVYKSTEPGITGLDWNSNPAGIQNGTGSMAMTADFSSGPAATGNIYKDLSPALDLTGKVLSIWIDVPASIAGQGWGIQVYALTGPTYAWNATWFNLDNPGWQQFSWPAGLADVRQIGMQILRNSSPVSYTGVIYTDEWTVTDAAAPTATNTPVATDTPYFSPTETATVTITATETELAAGTATDTPMDTPTMTETPVATDTPVSSPTFTATITPTSTVSAASGPPWPFDSSTMGFVNDIYSDLACTSLVWDGNAANAQAGPGSIYGVFDFSASATVQGFVSYDMSAFPLDLTNKTLSVWVNVPVAIAGQGYGLQLAANLPVWNAKWFNLDVSGWQEFTFDVNAAGVTQIGVMISRNSSATIYIGSIQMDEITVTDMVAPGPPWTFDVSKEGFQNSGTEPAITALAWNPAPAGITHGAGSLAMTTDFSSALTATGYVYKDLSAPLDMSGKTLNLWVNVPAACVGYGLQMVAKTGPALAWNATWRNVSAAGWQRFVWDITTLADVRQVGIQLLRNSGTSYTGTIYTDEWDIYTTPVAPGAIYNFDASAQGWTNDTITDPAVTALAWDSVAANAHAGAGSIVCTADFSGSTTAQGYVLVDLLAAPVDLTGKTLEIWMNVPAGMVGYGAQIAYKTGPAKAWNASWVNISAAGWQKLSCLPNIADVTEIGIQFLRNGAGSFTGTFNLDEITYY